MRSEATTLLEPQPPFCGSGELVAPGIPPDQSAPQEQPESPGLLGSFCGGGLPHDDPKDAPPAQMPAPTVPVLVHGPRHRSGGASRPLHQLPSPPDPSSSPPVAPSTYPPARSAPVRTQSFPKVTPYRLSWVVISLAAAIIGFVLSRRGFDLSKDIVVFLAGLAAVVYVLVWP
jgi:hypothetical protein